MGEFLTSRKAAWETHLFTFLRQAEADEHDGEACELREARHLAEDEEADQQGEARHQRGKHRGAPGSELHHRAREQVGRARAGEEPLGDELHEILDETQSDHALEAEDEPVDRKVDERYHARDRDRAHRRDAPAAQQGCEHCEQRAGGDEGEIADEPVRPDRGDGFGSDYGEAGDDDGAPARSIGSTSRHQGRGKAPSAAQEGWITPPWASGTNKPA